MRNLVLLLLILSPALADAQVVGLRPGDVLDIEIWREEDLSGEFLVNESGTVTLPLLGQQAVTGISVDSLRSRLLGLYRVQLRNPSITITPLRRVYVLGQVNAPGLYEVNPTISMAGAIALAGGASSEGDLDNLRVFRDGAVLIEDVPVQSAMSTMDIRSGDQIFVGRRSWLDRNSTFLVSAVLSVTSIVISLLVR